MKILLLTFFSVFMLGASSCESVQKLLIDPSQAATQANDTTVIVEGCGNQPIAGYTYCRKSVGPVGRETIKVHVPPAKCQSGDCTSVQIFFPNGSPTIGKTVPRDKGFVTFTWEEILQKKNFSTNDRGFWTIITVTKFVGSDGIEREVAEEAEIRLRVLSRNYVPLISTQSSEYFVWDWVSSNCEMKKTTAGRTYVGCR